MAEDVAGAVHPRPFAVPDGEYAIELAFAAQLRGLRAPHGGGRKVLVDAGLEDNVVGSQDLGGAHELLIEAAQRRAAITRNVPRRVEAGAAVALLLHQSEPHQCLVAGHEDAAAGEGILVVERDVVERHEGLCRTAGTSLWSV